METGPAAAVLSEMDSAWVESYSLVDGFIGVHWDYSRFNGDIW